MEILGWIGSLLLAICGLPQAIQSIQTQSSAGISLNFLLLWFFGEVFTLIYIFPKKNILPLIFNYSLNILFILIILYYKFFGV